LNTTNLKIFAAPLLLSLTLASSAHANAKADSEASSAQAKTILVQLEDRLYAAKSISFTCTRATSSSAEAQEPTVTTTFLKQSPDKYSIMTAENGKDIDKFVCTLNGGYVYDITGNQYLKIEKSASTDDENKHLLSAFAPIVKTNVLRGLVELIGFFGSQSNPLSFSGKQSDLSGIKLRFRSAPGELNGRPMPHVVESIIIGDKPETSFIVTRHFYIDRETKLPLRMGTSAEMMGQTATTQADFSSFRVDDAEIASDAFEITPPATAKLFTPPPAKAEAPEAPVLANGAKAPDFTVEDVHGKKAHLTDFKGKVVVIDFWATWCGPCQEALPGTDKIAKAYKSKGVVFLPICSWDQKSAFTPWVKQRKNWTMTFYRDPTARGDKSIASGLFKVSGIPTQFVIGKDGKVSDSFVGYHGSESEQKLVKAIDKALGGS
jgi:thiol-disulfide isomerase/thioredoxin/outer membrane lipoprotein-sorting protein